ncbi:O-fucosyltransferase family protein [Zea mays]|uniref:O-fucosyltransferase family protein n=1 Tax=Zea mays TaxID=4577 RepID=A0A1D6EHF8_MAIZE|nr:O-fucosyltransferase family protein [Zea mays]
MQVAAAAASMRGTETVGAKSAARRLSRVLVGRRRRAAVLLLALAYAAAMLMLTIGGSEGSGSSGVVAGVLRRGAQSAPPGSVYRSHLVFERLLPEMRAFASRPNPLVTSQYKKFGKQWEPCISKGLIHSELPPSNGFLIVEANGGLNQQRISICDAIAVAKILNATLVTPAFHLNSVWRDSRMSFQVFSKFGDIFDEDHFIESLRKYVRVVKDLPEDVFLRFNHNISIIPNMRTKAFSPPSYYLQHVLPKLLELGAVRIAPFSNRLAHSVPMNIQALRCLTNYKALRFSEPIRILADNMVDRMIKRSFLSGGNLYKVGMMLRGMGFDNTTSLYVASGKIYNAEKYMTPLRRLFPFLQTKHALVTPEELAQFKGHSSRLAALDYTICLHSEVFVMTQGSNFPHFLMGHRRYMYGGHAKTIKPDKRKLVQLFDNPNIR